MLRTFITAGIIILILGLGGYWHNDYLNQTTYTIVEKVNNVEDQILEKNWNDANQEIERVKTEWDETKKLWSILLDHQEIDSIDLSLQRVEQYIKQNETALSLGEISVLRLLFNHIADTERISLQNIF